MSPERGKDPVLAKGDVGFCPLKSMKADKNTPKVDEITWVLILFWALFLHFLFFAYIPLWICIGNSK